MASKKKKKDRSRDRDRSRDKRKSERKNKDRRSKSRKRKRKDKKKYQSSSQSDSSSVSSSSSRSHHRSRSKSFYDKKSKKKQSQKSKSQSNLPFADQYQPPVLTFKGPQAMVVPLPTPQTTTNSTIPKSKTKQYHIFKLFPKLPAGPVTIARTVYSSQYLSKQFQKKLFTQMCDELQKSARSQNYKKMGNLISKAKNQILSLPSPHNNTSSIQIQQKNQYVQIDKAYENALFNIRNKFRIKKEEAINQNVKITE